MPKHSLFIQRRERIKGSPIAKRNLLPNNPRSLLLKPGKNFSITMSFFGHYWMTSLKAFVSINHKLLIAKLHSYGLDSSSLRLIHSYLNNKQQRVHISNDFSTWSDIKDGVSQASILGPLFVNIHICDLFYIMWKWPTANYAEMTLHPTLVVKILRSNNFT